MPEESLRLKPDRFMSLIHLGGFFGYSEPTKFC